VGLRRDIEAGEVLRAPDQVYDEMGITGRGCLVEIGAPDGFTTALAARLSRGSQLIVVEPDGLVPQSGSVRQVRTVPRGVVPQLAMVWLSATRPATVLRPLVPKLAPGARLWVVMPDGEGLEHPAWNRSAVMRALAARGMLERGQNVPVSNRRCARLIGQGMVPPPR
jgi:hypothetical protein